MKLSREDMLHIQTAEGWLELGLHAEALRELDHVQCKHHPLALKVAMAIAFAAKNWSECLDKAMRLMATKPDHAGAHIACSITLYRLGRTEEAWDVLLPASEQYPKQWDVPYNLACYAAQLGWRERALEMFDLAMDRGDARTIKEVALKDTDMQPIWMDIADD